MTNHTHHTARRHGVSDDDIQHAIRLCQYREEYDDGGRILYLGPNQAGNMLEILSIREEDEELVIHAMPMQAEYETLLRGRRRT